MEFKYTIGDKTYIQKPLVLGQIMQLIKIIDGLKIPSGINTLGLIAALGDRSPLALAIVLTEEGKSPKDKDIEAFSKEIQFDIRPEEAIKVVEDFFDCNQVPSLLKSLSDLVGKITAKIGSKSSLSSSPEETLPKKTKSSGDIPSENASPI